MITRHLFYGELEQLELKPLVGTFSILIVGTFNAAIPSNNAEWYYDRPENEFWFLLPKMLNHPSLHILDSDLSKEDLLSKRRKYIQDNNIVIVDLFKQVNFQLKSKSDKLLSNLTPGQYLSFDFKKAFANCSFKTILFTRKTISKKQYDSEKDCRIGILIDEYKRHFQHSKFIAVESPSSTNAISRYNKLNDWSKKYSSVNNLY